MINTINNYNYGRGLYWYISQFPVRPRFFIFKKIVLVIIDLYVCIGIESI